MKKVIYILHSGELKKKDKTLLLLYDNKKRYFPIESIQELYIMGNIKLNSNVIELLSYKNIPTHFFNYHGRYIGSFYPLEKNFNSNVLVEQLYAHLNKKIKTEIAKSIISKAVSTILQNLYLYENKNSKDRIKSMMMIKAYRNKISNCDSIKQIMAYEGIIRKIYYRQFNYIINNDYFYFSHRTRRPPKDPINALISFGNSILYTDVLNEIFKTHLDPRIGFLHESNNRKFTLNLDIAEIFKPLIVDRTIFSLVNKGQIQFKHFENHKNGIFLSQEGIRIFLSTYNKRIGKVVNDSRTENIENSYRTMIRKECYRLEELFHKLKQNTRWVQLCS